MQRRDDFFGGLSLTHIPAATLGTFIAVFLLCVNESQALSHDGPILPALSRQGGQSSLVSDTKRGGTGNGSASLAYGCSGETTPTAPRLVLKWIDSHRLFTFGTATIREEVREVFGKIGVQTVWSEGNSFTSFVGDAKVQVLLRPSEPRELGLPENAMGVVLNKKSPQSAVWLFFPTVARNLGYDPEKLIDVGRLIGWQEKWSMARALGRIIAHEVVHAVAPELHHASKGVMSSRLYGGYILKNEVTIDEHTAAVFRRELAKLGALAMQQAAGKDDEVGETSGSNH